MRYAVIKTGGKQYRVKKGDELEVEKLDLEEGKNVTLDEVLLVFEGEKVKLGTPVVKSAKVKVKVLKQLKGNKIRVARFRHRSRYSKVKGHRQLLTRVKIIDIC